MEQVQENEKTETQKQIQEIQARINCELDPAYHARIQLFWNGMFSLQPKVALDAGCGRGFLTQLLTKCNSITSVISIDAKEENLLFAKKYVQDKKVTFLQADLHEIPVKKESVDLIVCFEVMEHVKNEDRVLKEFQRILVPGGKIFFSVPNYDFPLFWDPVNWILMRGFHTHVNKDIHWLAGIWADHERLYKDFEFKELISRYFFINEFETNIHWCWPFSHFLLYGIGKNLIDKFHWKLGNRFDPKSCSIVGEYLATFFRSPSILLDRFSSNKSAVQIFLQATKI